MYFFILASLIFSTVTQAQTLFERLGNPPLVAAHRGGFFDKSHNTLEQFRNAIKARVDIIEMDIRLTKDGIVVVYHDETMEDHSNCKGALRDYTYAELSKKCFTKGAKHKIPTFEETLQLINGRSVLNVEFKVLEVIEPAIQLVRKYNAYDWAYFQANAEKDKYFKARGLDSKLALLYKVQNDKDVQFVLDLNDPNMVVIQFDKEDVTPERLRLFQSLGKLTSVNSWKYGFADERFKSACKKVFEIGIDIAVSNNNKDCVKVRDQIKSNL